ncbi:MAG: DUF3368 domain-containing protein [Bacteroidales bacterium]|nr:DUF3368 domain-containing protein [Bacteroidales bacterium]
MIVISDTSTLSGLILIGRIDILTHIFNQIFIPKTIKEELLSLIKYSKEINDLINKKFIIIKDDIQSELVNDLAGLLDKGEAQAIALSIELNADLLIMDEMEGRTVAKAIGLNVIGLLGLLIIAKRKNIVEEVKPIMDDLKEKAGFWIGNNLYESVLIKAGEKS